VSAKASAVTRADIRLLWQLPDESEHVRFFSSLSEARENIPTEATDWAICRVVRQYGTGWVKVLDCIGGIS
jgi:hypothetical protein